MRPVSEQDYIPSVVGKVSTLTEAHPSYSRQSKYEVCSLHSWGPEYLYTPNTCLCVCALVCMFICFLSCRGCQLSLALLLAFSLPVWSFLPSNVWWKEPDRGRGSVQLTNAVAAASCVVVCGLCFPPWLAVQCQRRRCPTCSPNFWFVVLLLWWSSACHGTFFKMEFFFLCPGNVLMKEERTLK